MAENADHSDSTLSIAQSDGWRIRAQVY